MMRIMAITCIINVDTKILLSSLFHFILFYCYFFFSKKIIFYLILFFLLFAWLCGKKQKRKQNEKYNFFFKKISTLHACAHHFLHQHICTKCVVVCQDSSVFCDVAKRYWTICGHPCT